MPAPNHGRDIWDFQNNQYIPYAPELSLLERLSAIFESVPREAAPANVRAHFRMLQSGVRLALEAPVPDIEAARAIIESATLPNGNPLPPALEDFRQALIAEFEN